ncbi:MAG: hypothetical protein WCT99_05210 [Bacteroidota bacterium]|jgi:hypothetical protein
MNDQFIGLTDIPHSNEKLRKADGNILRNVTLQPMTFNELSQHSHDAGEPTVRVVRDGEKIVSIEFQCSCGSSKTLNVDYEDE